MSVPNLWRTKKQRYALQGVVCPDCANVMFPPRGVCPHCSQNRASAMEAGAVPQHSGRRSHSVIFAMPVAAPPVRIAAGDD